LSITFCDFVMPHSSIFVILLVVLEILLVIFMILSDIIKISLSHSLGLLNHFCVFL
jgi:hypothetical protein